MPAANGLYDLGNATPCAATTLALENSRNPLSEQLNNRY